jgi:hypothetical protein
LNRVDLPTLGRPTIATVKLLSATMVIAPQCWRQAQRANRL